MTKRDTKKILSDYDELKSNLDGGKKMFKDAYCNELKKLRTIEKTLKSHFSSKKPITEGDLCLAIFGITKQLEQLLEQNYEHFQDYIKDNERIVQVDSSVRLLFSFLEDFTRETGTKDTQKKIRQLARDTKDLVDLKDAIVKVLQQKKVEIAKKEAEKSNEPSMYG